MSRIPWVTFVTQCAKMNKARKTVARRPGEFIMLRHKTRVILKSDS